MRMRLLALWLVLTFIVQGCNAPPVSTVETHNQESVTPVIDTSRPTLPPIAIPSVTVIPTANPSLAITNTPLPSLKPVQSVQVACFTMLPALPDTKTYHGKIIYLTRGNYEKIQDSHLLASLYDLNTRQTMSMDPEKVNNIQVSPDGLTYAVHDKADNKVKFYSANGQLLRILPPGENPYGLDL